MTLHELYTLVQERLLEVEDAPDSEYKRGAEAELREVLGILEEEISLGEE